MWPFRGKSNKQQPSAGVVIDPFLGDLGARRLREALNGRDWATAREILTGQANNDDRAFYLEIAGNTNGVQDWIEGPLRDEPDSTLPLLVRGAHALYWAWQARGVGMAHAVSEKQWKVWFSRLKLAEDCLDEVLAKDPKCVDAWYLLVILARARQLSTQERWDRYQKMVGIDPVHHFGHDNMLQNLTAKWSGSAEEMFEFARTRAAGAPGTALPAMIVTAHLEQRWDEDDEYLEQPEVGDEIVAAAEQSIWHPDYRRAIATPTLWNRFAYAFSLAGRWPEAKRCFDLIGDDYYVAFHWSPSDFLEQRRRAGWYGAS